MDEIVISGGRKLTGEIAVSGSKNAVLPLMVAGLLTNEKLTLRGTPRLADTRTLANVRVSARRGVPRKVNFSFVSRPATMSGKTAFFEPETAISPVSLRPPEMTISSIVFFLISALFRALRGALRCFAAFLFCRFAAFQIFAQSRCQLFLAVSFFITCIRHIAHAFS